MTLEIQLPADAAQALLIGRIWQPGVGPVLVAVQGDGMHDLSRLAPTCSQLLEEVEPAAAVRRMLADAPRVAGLAQVLANSAEAQRDTARPWLLAPCDLQVIKASGVTFVSSLLERVIEEQARGDPARAQGLRTALAGILGNDLSGIVPGSSEAERVKQALIERGAWPDRRERNQIPDLCLSLRHNLLRNTYSRWLRFAKFHSSVALVSCQVNSSPDTTSLRS